MKATRVLVVVLVAIGALVVLAAPAGAHAVLVQTEPAQDTVVDAPPDELVLTFTEGVETTEGGVRLLDPSGSDVPGVTASADGDTIRASVPTLTTDGSYTVNWSAVSADGHPVSGAYLFHLREQTLEQPADAVTGGTPLVASLLRAGGAALAIAGLVGVFAFAFLDRRPRWRWVPVVIGTLSVLAGAVVAVRLQWGDAVDIVAATTSGRVAMLAVAVSLLGMVVSWFPRAGLVELAVAAATTVAVAAQGHAVSIPPVALSAGATVAHVAAAVAWATALVWMERCTRTSSPAELHRAVTRWSPWGIVAVVVLAATGAVLVVDRVGIGDVVTTPYGRLGLAKVGLLAVAVALALRNRVRLAPALVSGDPAAADPAAAVRRLRTSLRWEVAVLAVALVAGAALAQVAPPDAAGAAPSGGSFSQRAAFGDGEVELAVEPGRRGTNVMHVTALGADGRLMEGMDDLSLSLTLPSEDVGPLEPEMVRVTTGHSLSYAAVPLAGEWTVEVIGRPSKFEELHATFTVPIGE